MKISKHKIKKIEFPKGINTLHLPFTPIVKLGGEGIYEEMIAEWNKYSDPKETMSVEIIHRVYIDHEHPEVSHNISQIIFHR